MKPRNQPHYHILRNLFQPSESRLKGATIKSNTDTYYDVINVYKNHKEKENMDTTNITECLACK